MKKELLIVPLLGRLLIGLVRVLEDGKMKLSMFLKMAILLFFCVFLFNATAQAQQGLCFLYYNETDCTLKNCYWCPTVEECYLLPSNCPTSCGESTYLQCTNSPTCHWCDNQYICFPQERPCTCGNHTLDPGEECDSTRYCGADCKCVAGYIPDPDNSGYCKANAICGNGILEPGEECENFTPKFCLNCKCVPPAVPNPDLPGFCKVVSVCGNGTVEEGEQCEIFSRNCVGCLCVDGTIPDPVNLGYCITPQVCGNGIPEGTEECDSTQYCGNNCKCVPPAVPNPDLPGFCKVVSVCGNGTVEQGEECDSTANCDIDCKCFEYYIPTSQGLCAVDVKVAVGDAVGEIPAFNVKSKGKFTVRFTGETAPLLNPSITMTTSDLYGKNTYVLPLYYQWDVNGDLVLQYSRQQMVQVLNLDQYTKKGVVQLVFGCWADANHFELTGMIKIVNK